MRTITAQRHARGIDGLDRRHRVALDARDLHQAADRVAGQAEIVFDGGSFFLKEDGSIPVELAYFEEDFQVIDTDNPTSKPIEHEDYIAKIHQALVLGIRDYFQKMGFKDAILGLDPYFDFDSQ